MTRKAFKPNRDFNRIRKKLKEIIDCDVLDEEVKIRAAGEWRQYEKLRLDMHKFNQEAPDAKPKETEEPKAAPLTGLRLVHQNTG